MPKDQKEPKPNKAMGMWLGIGIALGVAFGASFNNLALGAAIGTFQMNKEQ